jgi:hypothetical protein
VGEENIGFLLGLDFFWIQILAGKLVQKSICSLLYAVAASAQMVTTGNANRRRRNECIYFRRKELFIAEVHEAAHKKRKY